MESLDNDYDSVFDAELTRRILMIMDDDNDNIKVGSKLERRTVKYGGLGGGLVASGNYYSWCESVGRFEVPDWMERLWASKVAGTGVFIPRVAPLAGKPRRRQNRVRKNNVNTGGRLPSSAYRIHG